MLLVFDILILIMLLLDCKSHKKIITPFSIITGVYTLLINLNNLFIANIYNFDLVSGGTMRNLLVAFLCLFLADVLFGMLYRRLKGTNLFVSRKYRFLIKGLEEGDDKTEYVLINAFFYLGVAAYALSFLINFAQAGFSIKGENNGILGHLTFFAFILAPVYLSMNWKRGRKILPLLFVAVLFGIAVLFGGKYVILINAVYLLLYFLLTSKKKLKTRTILFILLGMAAAAFSVFMLIYVVMPMFPGVPPTGESVWISIKFAIKHFFIYLLSPVIGNNYALNVTINNPAIAFCVPINVFKKLFGGTYINPIFPPIFRYGPIDVTNVAGLIGEATYCMGFAWAMLYVVAIVVVANVFYFLFRTFRQYSLTISYLFAILCFSFFCNFFSVSGVVLPLVYLFLLETALQMRRRAVLKKAATKQRQSQIKTSQKPRKLAIIMLNWNGTEDTIECLQSLAVNKTAYDVFVLDNGSKAEQYARLEEYVKNSEYTAAVVEDTQFSVDSVKGQQLYLIKSEQNRGFAGGNNFIAERVYGVYEYVLLLNNDTIVPKDSIASMLDTIQKSKDVALTCDIRYNADRRVLWNAGGDFQLYGDRKYYSQRKIDRLIRKGKTYIEVDFITGCAMLIDCDYVQEYGLLTDRFFHGEEDYNFCVNALERGKTLGVDLRVQIYHKVGMSINRDQDENKALRTMVLHYTNRVVDYKHFFQKSSWLWWRNLYLSLVLIKRRLKGMKASTAKLLKRKVYEYADKYDHVQRDVFLEIMNDEEIVA